MKFTCLKEELLKVVGASDVITGHKGNYSILSNILFEVIGDKVFVKANNMNMSLEASLKKATIEKEGAITLYQNKFFNLVKEIPEKEILIEVVDDNKVLIKSLDKKRNVKAVMMGISKSEFPELPKIMDQIKLISIDKILFKKMIQKTIFAVSHSNTQYTLNGVYMEYKNNMLKFVAIDGRRLALFKTLLSENEHEEFEVIIPQEFFAHLQKIIFNEGPMQFCFQENRFFFLFDNMCLSSNVLEGKFPNYNLFIPSKHENQFFVKTKSLLSAVNFVSTLIDEESHKMIWEIENKQLKIFAKNSDYGESEESLDIVYSAKPYKIGLNYKLISDVIRQIEVEEVEFQFNNQLSPILVKEKNRDEYYFIVMPMKLEEI